ncbi:hypothetical protein [Nocardia fusca]|uniref:hypothetical protein n=1 Tax=Nocardia fusca TaxID=941183 RepID=UPI0007A76442|nr:hypothetical protein [Nocardia fusca]
MPSGKAFQFFAEAVWQDRAIDEHFGRVFNVQESLSEFLTNPRVLAGLGRYGVKKLLKRTGYRPRFLRTCRHLIPTTRQFAARPRSPLWACDNAASGFAATGDR